MLDDAARSAVAAVARAETGLDSGQMQRERDHSALLPHRDEPGQNSESSDG
jgi:hypothetical protein